VPSPEASDLCRSNPNPTACRKAPLKARLEWVRIYFEHQDAKYIGARDSAGARADERMAEMSLITRIIRCEEEEPSVLKELWQPISKKRWLKAFLEEHGDQMTSHPGCPDSLAKVITTAKRKEGLP
jgi:hypothetical protein